MDGDPLTAGVPLGSSGVLLRRARAADLPDVLRLLADDDLGRDREAIRSTDGLASDGAVAGGPVTDLDPYLRAFVAIDADPAQLLVVADDSGEIVGTLQLTLLPGLARRGSLRAQVEAVRVASSRRGSGLGTLMLGWVVAEARSRGASLVQLTSDARRTDAHRFYERLGFVASHVGMKLRL